jgi:surface antigen
MKLRAISAKSTVRKAVAEGSKLALLLAMAGSLALASTEMAKAQMINPFGTYNGPTLGKEDYKLSNAAVEKLLDRKTPTVGAYDTWNNPASGNHGKFTIREIFTSQGMPCRKVNSSIYYHRSGAHRSFTLDVCQLPNGEWKIVS